MDGTIYNIIVRARARARAHTHTHTHTNTHTNTHTHTYTHIHTNTHTHIHTHIHTQTHTNKQTCIPTICTGSILRNHVHRLQTRARAWFKNCLCGWFKNVKLFTRGAEVHEQIRSIASIISTYPCRGIVGLTIDRCIILY